ncbi:MAG: hypothetical protein JSV44_00495 [Candidatus Zixiibacteriota bacterium]|nr:MAG: hypothetical protein JSV44_00495 [candidate division Zixibacteria bacterium]
MLRSTFAAVALFSLLILTFVLTLAFIACDEDDPMEQVVFKPGKYDGIYKTIQNYGGPISGRIEKVDAMTFDFKEASPKNMLYMKLNPDLDNDRDHCDWTCNWILDRDSMLIDTVSFGNSICDHREGPHTTFFHVVDGRTLVFYKYDPGHPLDLYRRIELYVP